MHSKKFDHVLTLKIRAEMRDEIDEALAGVNDASGLSGDLLRLLVSGIRYVRNCLFTASRQSSQ
jgi:hypothetical protein